MKRFLHYSLGFIFSVCIFLFVFSSISVNSIFPVTFSMRAKNICLPLNLESMQALYFSILVGVCGVYATVLSIFLNVRNTLSVKKFFKYSFGSVRRGISIITLSLILGNLIIPIINTDKQIFFYFQIISILELFVFIFLLFGTLFFLEDSKMCAKQYLSLCYSAKYKRIDFEKSRNFYIDFVRPSFRDSAFDVFYALHELQIKKGVEVAVDAEVIKNLLKLPDFKTDTTVLTEGLKMFSVYVNHSFFRGLLDGDIDNIITYRDLFFEFYLQLFYCNAITYPYILEIGIACRYYLSSAENLKAQKDLYDKVCNFYAGVLMGSKQMVWLSLYHCNFVDFHSHLKDFMNLAQGLDIVWYDRTNNLRSSYERMIVDILTHIVNMVQMQRLTESNLLIVFKLLPQLDSIIIGYGDIEQYFELVPPIGFHDYVYSRNYYIFIILVLCAGQNDDLYESILKKISFGQNSSNNTVEIYELLLQNAKNVTDDDLSLIRKGLAETKKNVILGLEAKVKELRNEDVQLLYNRDVSSELESAVLSLEESIEDIFSSVLEKYDGTENLPDENRFYIPLVNSFSVKTLINRNNNNVSYDFLKNYLLGIICNQYAKRNIDAKKISSISEILNLEEQNIIYASREAFDNLVNDKHIHFNGSSIEVNGKKIEVFFFEYKDSVIITETDLKTYYAFDCVTDYISKAQKEIVDNDVCINILFHIYFVERQGISIPIFRFK